MTTARAASSHLAGLLRREQQAMADFLVALAAFDRDALWVELGHASLFAYLRDELKLSAGAAHNRKTAAALVRQYPQVEAALRDGRLCLSSVTWLAKVITPERAADILPRFFGKSSREAELVAASIRPAQDPPRRALVTPVRSPPTIPDAISPMDASRACAAAPRGEDVDRRELPFHAHETERGPTCPPAGRVETAAAPVDSAAPVGDAASPLALDRPRIKPLDAERARVSMTVTRRLLDKLSAARDALSHSHPRATEEEILEVGLDLILQRHARRRGLVDRPRDGAGRDAHAPTVGSRVESENGSQGASAAAEFTAASGVTAASSTPTSDTRLRPRGEAAPVQASPTRRRHVPAAVSREVWLRDQGRCQWPLDSGGVCGSTYRVQLDHVVAVARGGETTVDTTRLLCAVHNDLHARRTFGDAWMDRFTRRKGSGCAEPVASYGPAGTGSPGANATTRNAQTVTCRVTPSGYTDDRTRGDRDGSRGFEFKRCVARWSEKARHAHQAVPGGLSKWLSGRGLPRSRSPGGPCRGRAVAGEADRRDERHRPPRRFEIGAFIPLAARDVREVRTVTGILDGIPVASDLDKGSYVVLASGAVVLRSVDLPGGEVFVAASASELAAFTARDARE